MIYKKLEELLDYEQPNNYIVEDTKYDDKYKTPVLTAGQSFILGYTNEENNIFKAKTNPVIIFDDFTTSSKYVDFDFKVKSSAMKILKAKDGVNIKYVYYLMQTIKFDNQLHKRYWISTYSKIKVPIPNIGIQDEIVKKLDLITKIVVDKQEQLQALNLLIKSQFVEMFERGQYPKDEFINIAKEIYAGGDKPKDISKVKEGEYLYPVFANGYENEGLQGYSKVHRTGESAVTISARGTIGYSFIRNEKFTPIVRLITIIPNEKANVVYLKYAIDNLNISGSGTSQAQLTVPDIKKKKIIVPPIELQNKFAEFVKQIDKQKFESEIKLRKIQKNIFYKWGR